MAKRVGVLLSGCGVKDGAEIQEAVLTLLALDQQGALAICCAPDVNFETIDHMTGKSAGERRNVLREAARITRGDIRDAAKVSVDELDALIIPGGFGVAKNLCGFATQGADCSVNPAVEKLIAAMLKAGRPIGAICIAPALLARVAGRNDIAATLTIGNDPAAAKAINAMGCKHQECPVTEFVLDRAHKIVSTPAYMLGPGPSAVFEGIRKLVTEVLALI